MEKYLKEGVTVERDKHTDVPCMCVSLKAWDTLCVMFSILSPKGVATLCMGTPTSRE